MRVVILGGTRFIGPAVLDDLLVGGHDVLVVHRGSSERDDLPAVPHVHADRRDVDRLRRALRKFRAEALVDTCASDRDDALSGVEALPPDTRAVVLSSMDVYRAYGALLGREDSDAVPLTEDSALRRGRYPYRGHPRYGDIDGADSYEKLDVEESYRAAGATILRLPMVYGERDGQRREEFVLRRVRARRQRIPFGAGTFLWTRAWVRDVARAVRLAVEHDAIAGEVFNVGEARTWTVEQWARGILGAAGSDAELVRVVDENLPDDLRLTGSQPQHLLVDSSRARATLGWFETDAQAALEQSVRWHLLHPPAGPNADFTADDEALATAGGACGHERLRSQP